MPTRAIAIRGSALAMLKLAVRGALLFTPLAACGPQMGGGESSETAGESSTDTDTGDSTSTETDGDGDGDMMCCCQVTVADQSEACIPWDETETQCFASVFGDPELSAVYRPCGYVSGPHFCVRTNAPPVCGHVEDGLCPEGWLDPCRADYPWYYPLMCMAEENPNPLNCIAVATECNPGNGWVSACNFDPADFPN